MNEVNNVTNNNFKENKKSLVVMIGIAILLILISGGTFAYFAFETSNSTSIGGDMGTIDLSLTVTKILPESEGVDNMIIANFAELADKLNDRCIDNNGEYALCQLYKVNLANSADSVNTNVKGSVSFNNETAPNLSWISLGTSYNSSTTYTSSMLGNSFNTASSEFENFVDSYLLTAGSNVDFYLLVWVNESEEEQNDEGTYSGTIRFEDASGKGVTSTFNNYSSS